MCCFLELALLKIKKPEVVIGSPQSGSQLQYCLILGNSVLDIATCFGGFRLRVKALHRVTLSLAKQEATEHESYGQLANYAGDESGSNADILFAQPATQHN